MKKTLALVISIALILSVMVVPASAASAYIGINATGGNELKTLTLPETLLRIDDSAFYRCFNLEEIIIPASVTSISTDAFRSCSKMTRVIFMGQPSVSNKAFLECPALTDIYVPWSMTTTHGEPWGAPNAVAHYLEDGWMEELFPESQEGE